MDNKVFAMNLFSQEEIEVYPADRYTLAKLSKNEYVSMDVLVRICIELDCSFDDVVEIVRDDVKVTK